MLQRPGGGSEVAAAALGEGRIPVGGISTRNGTGVPAHEVAGAHDDGQELAAAKAPKRAGVAAATTARRAAAATATAPAATTATAAAAVATKPRRAARAAQARARVSSNGNGNGDGKGDGARTAHAANRSDAEIDRDADWDRAPVSVLVIDGDSDGRNRLCQIITKGAHVTLTGGVATLSDAVEVARRTKPEVVLSELFLPDGDPAALKHRFIPLAPRPALVVITRFSVRGARVASTVAGARTCLASSAPPDSVLAAILAAAKGESWDGAGAVGSRLDRVSPLEAKVLAGVASGATNDEIARALGYSIHYVKDLLEAVRHRLGAKDRAHAASLAVSLRLIRPARDGRFISAVPS